MKGLNRSYGTSLGWLCDRRESGELSYQEEPTADMIADPLTKVMGIEILLRRGIMVHGESVIAQYEVPEPAPGFA